MEKVLDILKIQKTLRKAIKDYAIVAKYDEEVLISFVCVDLYLNLTEEATPPPSKVKRNVATAGQQVVDDTQLQEQSHG